MQSYNIEGVRVRVWAEKWSELRKGSHTKKESRKELLRLNIIFENNILKFSVQLLSHVRLFVTPWTAAYQAFLSITAP